MNNVNDSKNADTTKVCIICGSQSDITTVKGKYVCMECVRGIGKL